MDTFPGDRVTCPHCKETTEDYFNSQICNNCHEFMISKPINNKQNENEIETKI